MEINSLWEQVLEWIAWVWAFWQVKFIVGHIVLNAVAATAASIYTNEFLLGKLGQFLYRKVLPLVLLFGAFAAFGEATQMSAMTNVAFAGIEAMLAADLLDNIKKVGLKFADNGNRPEEELPIITIPDWLTK